MTVKFLRLTNNEDIIADVELVGDEYIVDTPMTVLYNNKLLGANPATTTEINSDTALMMLSPWVLPSMIRGSKVNIHRSNVMFAAEVPDKIFDYYDRITSLMKLILSGKKLSDAFDPDIIEKALSMSSDREMAEEAIEKFGLSDEDEKNLDPTTRKKGKLLH